MAGKQCPRCKRQVYSAEERLALGRSWHIECFTCAVCNKTLDSTNITENQENQEIYCKNCYRVLYGTKGYGYGPNEPTLLAQNPPEEECYEVTPSPSNAEVHQFHGENKAVIVKPFEELPFRKAYSYWGKRPTPRHYGNQVVPVPASERLMKKCDPDQQYPPRQQYQQDIRSSGHLDQEKCSQECIFSSPTYQNFPQQHGDSPKAYQQSKVYQQSWLNKEPTPPANCQAGARPAFGDTTKVYQQSWLEKEPVPPANCQPGARTAYGDSTKIYQQSWLEKEPAPPANCQTAQRPAYRQAPKEGVPSKPKVVQESWSRRNQPGPEKCEPPTTTIHSRYSRPAVASQPKSRQKTFRSSSNADICGRCGNPVYFAEKKMGYHGVYHTRCYVCCSCGKSLESTTVSENNGALYCKGCYKRFVATGGVGYGIGAGALQTH